VRYSHNDVHFVLDQNDRIATLESLDEMHDALCLGPRQSRRRLVQQQQTRLWRKSDGEVEQPLITMGKFRRRFIGVTGEAIRAILLASAMAATLVGRRPSNAVSQGRCPVPWILA
jgi:hypothetical protein